ncbi:MAG: sodium-dependent transporter [Spirochaetaceae bacterium]|nr:sodium-dependent transporter [Spirochaetaceae bacterium]
MKERESLASRLGFILLSAGCAIGLGNVWRFPYITGKYGGAIFVLVYLFFLVALGLPIMVMEFSVGRASRQNVGKAFKTLEPQGTKWHTYGHIAIAGNYILMMFYATISGWLLYYCFASLTGQFQGLDTAAVGAFFGSLTASSSTQFLWMAIAVVLSFVIVGIGLEKGVEKITKVMMILLILLIVVLAVNSVLLPGSGEGIKFYLLPDFSKVTESGFGEVVFAAMGQAFFTLSLGIGSMEIFGSYIDKKYSLTGEAGRIILLDTFVAIMSGLIIFPACFAYDVNPGAGPELLFITMPNIFNNMAGSRIWSSLFFVFMSFAALSTLIAVFENIVSYWIDTHGWGRKKACVVNCIALIILSLPCILGFNLWSGFQPLGAGTGVLDLEDFIVSSTLLPLGSLIFLVFCCSKKGWGWDNFVAEADAGEGFKFPRKIKFYIKWILPLIVLIIFVKGYYDIFSKMF